jgi:hypothetical protein
LLAALGLVRFVGLVAVLSGGEFIWSRPVNHRALAAAAGSHPLSHCGASGAVIAAAVPASASPTFPFVAVLIAAGAPVTAGGRHGG